MGGGEGETQDDNKEWGDIGKEAGRQESKWHKLHICQFSHMHM